MKPIPIPAKDSPSPFLPGTNIQYAWDSTSLGMLKTCPRLYYYKMVVGWGEGDESIHLRFGIEFHQALQEYDIAKAKGASHQEALRISLKDLMIRVKDWRPDRDTKAGKYKNEESIIRTFLWYLFKYEDDPAETVILADGRPAVELSFRFELDWGPRAGAEYEYVEGQAVALAPGQPYLLSGHLDRVVSFNSTLFVMDRKTTTTTPGSYYFNQFEPNNQMTLYTLASQVIVGSPVKGVIIDAAQILVSSNDYVRGFTYRTPDQLEEWLADLKFWLNLSEQYAIADHWPMNDTACDKFGGCQFREICSKSPQVREKFLAGKFTKLAPEERWNPLRSR